MLRKLRSTKFALVVVVMFVGASQITRGADQICLRNGGWSGSPVGTQRGRASISADHRKQ